MTPKFNTFSRFFKDLRERSGIKFYLSLATMVYLGLTEGIGLMMIIPFIALAGIGDAALGKSALIGFVQDSLAAINFTPTLLSMLLVYVVLVSFYAIVKYIQARLNVAISQNIVSSWRAELYQNIVHSEWTFVVTRKLPELVNTLVKEISQIGQGTNQFVQLIGSGTILLVQTVLAFLISPGLCLIAVSGSFILGVASKRFNKRSFELGQRDFGTNRNLHTQAFEQLSALKLAKSYGLESKVIEEFESMSNRIASVTIEMRNLSAKNKMLISIGSALLLSAFFFAAINWLNTSLVQLMLLAFIFTRMIPKISSMVSSYQGILNMLPAYSSVVSLQNTIVETSRTGIIDKSDEVSFKEKVVLRNISFEYIQSKPVFENLTIEFKKGTHTAIIGESGKGKSTLADLLMGLIHPTEGEIVVDSITISNSNIRNWRKQVGYIPQDNFLFNDSLKNNLKWLAPESTHKELTNALKQAEIYDFIQTLPDKLDTVVGDRGIRLSGGQRQRIILARTLLLNPEILILDEATSALDPANETAILQTIRNLKSNITVIIISHKKSISSMVDRVIDLDELV